MKRANLGVDGAMPGCRITNNLSYLRFIFFGHSFSRFSRESRAATFNQTQRVNRCMHPLLYFASWGCNRSGRCRAIRLRGRASRRQRCHRGNQLNSRRIVPAAVPAPAAKK